MSFLENIFNTKKIRSLELEILGLKANHNMLLNEYRDHYRMHHDAYKKIMRKAEEVKKENKKRGRRRKDNK